MSPMSPVFQSVESVRLSDLVQITGWLRDSGLKVNEDKTELCLFYKKDTPMITINFGDTTISSTSIMILNQSIDQLLLVLVIWRVRKRGIFKC